MTNMMITVKMPRWQQILGWILMATHLLILPYIILFGCELLGIELNNYTLNIATFVAAWILTLAIFHKFLIQNIKTFGRSAKKTFLAILAGLGVYFVLNTAVNTGITNLFPDFYNANESSLDSMAQYYYFPLLICTVLLVPVTEEVIYRGVLFQIVYHKNRILAYVLTTVIFAAIHIVGYIGYEDPFNLFIAFHQYLPAGIALAFAYEMSDSIWAPIIIHSTINLIAMLL